LGVFKEDEHFFHEILAHKVFIDTFKGYEIFYELADEDRGPGVAIFAK